MGSNGSTKMDVTEDDLGSFMDLESQFCAADFVSQLPDDLELPMLPDGDLLSSVLAEVPLDDAALSSDSSDSGVESLRALKSEPLSPTSSHCSDLSQDSLHHYHDPTAHIITGNSPMFGGIPEILDHSLPIATTQLTTGHTNVETITVIKQEIPDIINVPNGRTNGFQQRVLPVSQCSRASPTSGISVVKIESSGTLTPPLTPTSTTNGITKSTVISNNPVPMKMVSVPGENGTIVKMLVPVNPKVKTETLSPASSGLVSKATSVSKLYSAQTRMTTKPIAPLQVNTSTASLVSGASKTLVLTPEEFNKLTSQKLINLKSGMTLKPIVTTTTPSVSVAATSPVSRQFAATKSAVTCLPQTDSDLKSIKRQQRMMKNRESACLSRKRKKEYMSTLEEKLMHSADENNKLKAENTTLRKTITVLKCENEKLKKVLPTSAIKGGTILLGVLLILSLNLGPLTSILSQRSPASVMEDRLRAALSSDDSVHHGRQLMAYSDYEDTAGGDDMDVEQHLKNLDQDWLRLQRTLHLQRDDSTTGGNPGTSWDAHNTSLALQRRFDELTQPSVCPTYFNSTESLRLLNDLRGWVRGHEELLKRQQETRRVSPRDRESPRERVAPQDAWRKPDKREGDKTRSKKKRRARKTKASAATGSQLQSVEYGARDGPGQPYHEVQVFTGAEQQYQSFLRNLQRRNDTFYVVSFRRDHLLLPATAHNKTMRPRMSVVMPAMGLNETVPAPDGSIAMMQIDCEVTATKLVHIDKASVPDHLDPNITHPGNPTMPQPQEAKSPHFYRDAGQP